MSFFSWLGKTRETKRKPPEEQPAGGAGRPPSKALSGLQGWRASNSLSDGQCLSQINSRTLERAVHRMKQLALIGPENEEGQWTLLLRSTGPVTASFFDYGLRAYREL